MEGQFSAVGVSAVVPVNPADSVTYTLDEGVGTFSGTILLQSSEYHEFGFVTEATLTGPATGAYINQTQHVRYVRFACTAYDGDAMDYTVTATAGVATGLRFDGNAIVDSGNDVKMSFTDSGVEFPGNVTQTGDISQAGDMDIVGDFSVTGTVNITGAIAQDGDLDVTGDITYSGSLYPGLNAALTAYAGGGQANAVALSKPVNVIGTCATALDSVKLPTPAAGMIVEVVNVGAKAAAVFPASGHTIDSLSADTAYRLESGSTQRFLGVSATAWRRLNRALRFVRVADPSAFHYSKTDLTVQTDTWTDLVLTGKVADLPPSCKVEFYLQAGDDDSRSVMLRTNGNSNAAEVIRCNSIGISNAIFASSYGSVYCDSASTVEYKVDATISGNVYVTIMGYWVEG